MHYREVTQSRQAYIPWLQELQDFGDDVEVRGLKTKEFLNAVTIVREPWHSCILIPSRRWNPWLALSEALWILAGRDDIKALLPYNSHIGDYSDDGVHLYGAYGSRIYHQIDDLVGRLKKDPNDRRAVLQIWSGKTFGSVHSPGNDLTIDSKDPPCLSGDTIVYSPEGNMPISELVGKRVPVYTLNEETKKIEFKWAEGVSKGIRTTITITLDDGSKIRTTPEHLFLTKKKSLHAWVKAEELKPGVSIVPIHFVVGKKGHLSYYEDVTTNWSGKNRKAVHREYWAFRNGERPQGYDVHHDNHVPDDNHKENLVLIKHGKHAQHHKSTALGREPKYRPNGFMKVRPNQKDWEIEELLDMGKAVLEEQGSLAWWRFNQKYSGIVSGTVVQARFGSWSNFVSSVVDNHKVVYIEEGLEEEVYDLQVEDNHNFFVAPGVLVHNCNQQVWFKLRQGKLHMTVTNRSNDLHFGLMAVNLPTFGILQSYIAARLGVDMGTQTHFSNSLHIYTDEPRAKAITERMLYQETEDMPKYPEHKTNLFGDLTSLAGGHKNFASWCSMVLDGKVLGYGGFPALPFFQFSQQFLKAYTEKDLSAMHDGYTTEFGDWELAGKLFAKNVWNK